MVLETQIASVAKSMRQRMGSVYSQGQPAQAYISLSTEFALAWALAWAPFENTAAQ